MEITTAEITIPSDQATSNALETAGMFQDDPLFDEMLAEVAAYRRALDEERA